MSGNALKKPYQSTTHDFAERKTDEFWERLSKSLPCSVTKVAGQIVTVAFQVTIQGQTLPPMTMPIATSLYDWLPIQIGDTGLAVPSDVYLGGISGLGGGAAGRSQLANLTALEFLPTARAAWTAPGGDPDKRVVQGPTGVLLQDTDGTNTITISKTSAGIVITTTAGSVTVNGVVVDQNGNVNAPGVVTASGFSTV